MSTDKKKRTSRPFSFRIRRFHVLIFVIGAVIFLKRDPIQFRLRNLMNPIEGEIVFHMEGDIGNYPQIYHLTFNTAWKSSHIDQLTTLPLGATYPVYSPDGKHIAFQSNSGDSIYMMNADGSDVRRLTEGHTPSWGSPTQIVFQRVVGSYLTDMIMNCPVSAPFMFDLVTESETPLYELPEKPPEGWAWHSIKQDNGMLNFDYMHPRGMACTFGNFLDSSYVPENPTNFHPLYQRLEDTGFLAQAFPIFARHEVLSPSGRHLIKTQVYPYPTQPSGLELYDDGQWRLIKAVDSRTVSWSPDEQYVVYDAHHPDGGWVLAISSIDGSFTYPLLSSRQQSYFAPSWRP